MLNRMEKETALAIRNIDAAIVGAGPAGLMAAEQLADAGFRVAVFEANPTAGRKLLMAGKSGLNLTMDEPFDRFVSHYGSYARWLGPILQNFDNSAAKSWAVSLGQEIFTGSSGRVFPKAMKSSRLLRAWLQRLQSKGVHMVLRWKWVGLDNRSLRFETPHGGEIVKPPLTVLALGGASWPRLGSDGGWINILQKKRVDITPLAPANMGFNVKWTTYMRTHFGAPVKSCRLSSGGISLRGEFVITSNGIEGGGIYAVSKPMREGFPLVIDLLPDLEEEEIIRRLKKRNPKTSVTTYLRKSLKLDGSRLALLQEFGRPFPSDPKLFAACIKSLDVPFETPRPIEEAISCAGGISQSALTEKLMLKELPGVFAAGEMLDWEAPTGGYLLTACLATGRWAGAGAVEYLHTKRSNI